jgi:hypothetical protein
MTTGSGPRAAGQYAERLIQPPEQLRKSEGLISGGGELDRQGQAIQPRDDSSDQIERVGRRPECRVDQPHPIDEQGDGTGIGVRAGAGVGAGVGVGPECSARHAEDQRPQPQSRLARHAERFPARGEDSDVLTQAQQAAAQFRHRGDQVLAIVQHQQRVAPLQQLSECLRHAPVRSLLKADGRRDRRRHQIRLRYGRELHQGDAAGQPIPLPPHHLGHQPGLAHTPRAPSPSPAGVWSTARTASRRPRHGRRTW